MKHLISQFFLLLSLSIFASEKPNIVIIMADDMGYECLGANGSQAYQTPNIDKLASEGVRFTQCFANPKCTPSRVKLMTGKYNARNYTKFGELNRSQTTFANLLKKEGYATVIAGKWQLGSEKDAPQHFGFDEACLWQHTRGRHRTVSHKGQDSRYPNPQLEINGEEKDFVNGEYGPDICNQFLCDFITKHKSEPFLLYYPMILPHWPWIATPDSEGWDAESFGPKENKPGTIKEQHLYYGDMVKYADKLVGNIIQTLEDNGLTENTLVIVLGDNGTDKPIVSKWNNKDIAGAKGFVKDEGTRVTCVVRLPETIKPEQNETDLVEFSDFLPTVCDFAGADLPPDYCGDGVSLMPTLLKKGQRHKPWVYMTYTGSAWARNIEYGVRLPKKTNTFEYQKFEGHYSLSEVSLDKNNPEAFNQFNTLRAVIDSLKKDNIFEIVN